METHGGKSACVREPRDRAVRPRSPAEQSRRGGEVEGSPVRTDGSDVCAERRVRAEIITLRIAERAVDGIVQISVHAAVQRAARVSEIGRCAVRKRSERARAAFKVVQSIGGERRSSYARSRARGGIERVAFDEESRAIDSVNDRRSVFRAVEPIKSVDCAEYDKIEIVAVKAELSDGAVGLLVAGIRSACARKNVEITSVRNGNVIFGKGDVRRILQGQIFFVARRQEE